MVYKYEYLTPQHLQGFKNYKYSAIDTSPLSNYVMHPFWNFCVKLIPKWVAPNLITFVGFLFLVAVVLVLTVFDFDCTAAGAPGIVKTEGQFGLPNWLYTVCAIFMFINYNLDGIDGKQARKIGVSGPLGEMFDHGLDSYVVFFIPYCLFSVFGRDEYSISSFRGYLTILSVILNFYVSHCEKYSTGTLYLPWGYDVSMWASSGLFLAVGMYGPGVFKTYVFGNMTFIKSIEILVHCTGLFTTLPIAVYNVYLTCKDGTNKKSSLLEILRPIWAMLIVSVIMTIWALISPNQVMDTIPRPFLLLLGTLFSNISCRLIVAEMSDQRCDTINWMTWPLVAGVVLSMYHPHLEIIVVYALLVVFFATHVHYGVRVVDQICTYFGISCFTVPKEKQK